MGCTARQPLHSTETAGAIESVVVDVELLAMIGMISDLVLTGSVVNKQTQRISFTPSAVISVVCDEERSERDEASRQKETQSDGLYEK